MDRIPGPRRLTMWPGAYEVDWDYDPPVWGELENLKSRRPWMVVLDCVQGINETYDELISPEDRFPPDLQFSREESGIFDFGGPIERVSPYNYIKHAISWFNFAAPQDDEEAIIMYKRMYYLFYVLAYYDDRVGPLPSLTVSLRQFWYKMQLDSLVDENMQLRFPIKPEITREWTGDVNFFKWNQALQQDEKAMRMALTELKHDTTGSWNRCKLMVVGQGRAGKTATVQNMLGMPFDPYLESTIGADLSQIRTVTGASPHWGETYRTDFYSSLAMQIVMQKIEENKEVFQRLEREIAAKREREKEQQQQKDRNVKEESKTRLPLIWDDDSSLYSVDSDGSGLTTMDPNRVRYRELGIENEQIKEAMRQFSPTLLANTTEGEEPLAFTIWDYGGQRVFYTLHHLFLSKFGIYLLVFDLRNILVDEEAEKTLMFWLNSIRLHAPKSPLFLAGTHLDEVEAKDVLPKVDEFLSHVKKEYTQVVRNGTSNFFPVNNALAGGSTILREAIEGTASQLDFVTEKVPLGWMECLDFLLENTKKPWVLWDRVLLFKGKFGLQDREEIEAMVALFHRLGSLLRFSGTEALNRLLVIDPQWVVDAFSEVIRDPKLHVYKDKDLEVNGLLPDMKNLFENGLVTLDLLAHLWKGEHIDFLVDLMRHTLLISEWSSNGERLYLVPSMIRSESEFPQAPGALCVLDFGDNFLPIGVFQRLICICVSIEREQMGVKDPEINKHTAVIHLKHESISLQEVGDTIQFGLLSQHKKSQPQKLVFLFDSMLRKLQQEIFGRGLVWKVKFQEGDLSISLQEARKQKLAPWFAKAKSSDKIQVDLNAFLNL